MPEHALGCISGLLDSHMVFREGLEINDAIFDVELPVIRDSKHAACGFKQLVSGFFTGFLHTVPAEEGGAGGTGSFVVGRHVGIARDKGDLLQRDPQNFRGQLGEGGFGALPHVT
ncbi:Uncharacterised protein [uncultured Blautia sp.]|jgi:hypothetical protein|nr:Uncharacterised protein [uncultured Blautia sp.]